MSETINFEDYYSNVEMWTEHCENFTIVPIGIVDSMSFELEYNEDGINGPASAHTVMIGSSGSGKTTFLHAFIMGLALKYSPKEVRFFLVDLRHGGFQGFALYKFPHAEIIANDVEWGLYTLELTLQKMEERRKLFDERKVESYREFRKNYPDEVLPRYFVIMENYEGMFRDSIRRSRARQYINIITEKARTYGINLFLSSQRCPLDQETLYNFTTKIVMKCEMADTARMLLGPGNRYSDTVPHLHYESLVVMANRTYKTKLYYLPLEQRKKYVEQINKKVIDEGMVLPCQLVFDGFAKAYLSNNHAYTQLRPRPQIKSVHFSPGEKVFVDGNDLMIKLHRAKGGNLYVTGGELQSSVRALYGCLASMLPQFEKNGENAVRFDMFNFVDPKEEFKGTLDKKLLAIAKDYSGSRVYDDSEMKKVLDEAYFDDLLERKNNMEKYYPSRFIVIFQMDNSESLNPVEEHVGSGIRVERSSAIKRLVDLVVEGPQYGIHCLLHTRDYSKLEHLCGLAIDKYNQIRLDGPRVFDPQKTLLYTMLSNVEHRVLLQMSAEESKALMNSREANSLDDWSYIGNRAIHIYSDAVSRRISTIIKPYEFEITPQEENQSNK